jgi:hypothetical protein
LRRPGRFAFGHLLSIDIGSCFFRCIGLLSCQYCGTYFQEGILGYLCMHGVHFGQRHCRRLEYGRLDDRLPPLPSVRNWERYTKRGKQLLFIVGSESGS